MKHRFLNLSIALLVVCFVSCKKEVSSNQGGTIAQLDVTNVSYGTDAAQTMDVHLPEGRTTAATKVIILVHGGSWESGDKNDFNDAIASIRGELKDYAIFNINYRLASGSVNNFPAAINDIDLAIDYINSKAAEYLINTNKIVLIGASAGAHLVLLKAYNENDDGKIKAVIDLFGPTDLTWMFFNHPFPLIIQPILINFLGTDPTTNPTLYFNASPINFVTAESPPTEIFHGTADEVVPISESEKLDAKLTTMSVPHEFTTYIGESHGWVGANLTDTYNKVIAFIKKYAN